jgi:hypothetical protein
MEEPRGRTLRQTLLSALVVVAVVAAALSVLFLAVVGFIVAKLGGQWG